MKIQLKIATEEKDIQSSHEVMLEAFREHSRHEIPSSALNERLEDLKEAIHNGTEYAMLCLVAGIPSGSVRFVMEEDSLYFRRLAVRPEARGKGLALAMIQWLEEYAKEKGKERIYCRVRMDTPELLALYEKADFVASGKETVINKDGNAVDTYVLEKSVTVAAG